MTRLDRPSNAHAGGSHKPCGLANTRRHATPIDTVIEDFIYEYEETSSQSDDIEDDLDFPGDAAESLVRSFDFASAISFLTHVQHRLP